MKNELNLLDKTIDSKNVNGRRYHLHHEYIVTTGGV